jgi:hypothetical protein
VLLSAVVLLVAASIAAGGGGGDDPVTARTLPSGRPSSSESAAAGSAPAVPSAGTSTTPTTTARPPTLELRLTGASYIEVRLANGRPLLARLMKKGQHRTFDQKVLRVTVGNAAAVRVTVNGKARKPGRRGQVVSFVARRK